MNKVYEYRGYRITKDFWQGERRGQVAYWFIVDENGEEMRRWPVAEDNPNRTQHILGGAGGHYWYRLKDVKQAIDNHFSNIEWYRAKQGG